MDNFSYNSLSLYSDANYFPGGGLDGTQSQQSTYESTQAFTQPIPETMGWSQPHHYAESVFAGLVASETNSQSLLAVHPSAHQDADVTRRSAASTRSANNEPRRGGGNRSRSTSGGRRPAALPRRASADAGGGGGGGGDGAALRRAQAENRDLRRQLEAIEARARDEEAGWKVLEELPARLENIILDKFKVS